MGENIFANHISDMDPIFRLYKELLQFNNKRQPSLKMSQDSEQTFFQRRYSNGQ